jgi:MSHA biogenesis protein MshM
MPFSKNIAASEIFSSRALADAATMLELGVETEDILLLTGPIGCGKSVALRHFISALDPNMYLPLYLTGNINSSAELYKRILTGLLIEPPFSPAKAKALYFKTITELSKKPVVIIDDAQDVRDAALLDIKSMINFDQDSKNRITFILAGQPELREKLSYALFASIRQRIKLNIALKGMGLEETCAYIEHNLKICGRPHAIFSDNAKSEIFKRSEGLARVINRICFKALIIGAIEKLDVIDSKDIPANDF